MPPATSIHCGNGHASWHSKRERRPFRIACVDIASIGGCAGPQHPILATDRKSCSTIGGVEPLPSEGKGHTFESCRVRQFPLILQRYMRARTEIPVLSHSTSKQSLEKIVAERNLLGN